MGDEIFVDFRIRKSSTELLRWRREHEETSLRHAVHLANPLKFRTGSHCDDLVYLLHSNARLTTSDAGTTDRHTEQCKVTPEAIPS